jgi:hypothetical protein
MQNEEGTYPYPSFDQEAIRRLIGGAPDDVRDDANDLMKSLIEACAAWQRKQNRVVDGRVVIIALHMLACQHATIMQRIMDEGVGPSGPHKN